MGSNEQKKTSIALLFRLLWIGFFFTFFFSLGLLIQSKTPTSPALPDNKRCGVRGGTGEKKIRREEKRTEGRVREKKKEK